MPIVKISMKDFATIPKKTIAVQKKRHKMAVKAALLKLRAYLIAQVNKSGITDTGLYKNSFVVTDDSLWNDAPHAGLVERGARPHPVSQAGVLAIAAWVRRKLRKSVSSAPKVLATVALNAQGVAVAKKKKFTKDEALEIAYAIAQKIKKFGQKGHYFMRDAIPKAKAFYVTELKRVTQKGLTE